MFAFLIENTNYAGEGGGGVEHERGERGREIFYRDATSLISTWERWQVKGQVGKKKRGGRLGKGEIWSRFKLNIS